MKGVEKSDWNQIKALHTDYIKKKIKEEKDLGGYPMDKINNFRVKNILKKDLPQSLPTDYDRTRYSKSVLKAPPVRKMNSGLKEISELFDASTPHLSGFGKKKDRHVKRSNETSSVMQSHTRNLDSMTRD